MKMNLKIWLKEERLKAHSTSREEIEKLFKIVNRDLRDRKEINATLLEGKFHSSIDDFSLQRELWLSAAEKSSKSERLFSQITSHKFLWFCWLGQGPSKVFLGERSNPMRSANLSNRFIVRPLLACS